MASSKTSRIPGIFQALRSTGRKGLMPFICGGYPQPGDTTRLLPALERGGASIVEVGFPFSDPIADGPVIAAAMHEALARGSTPGSVFAEIAAARASTALGIVCMISASLVWRLGPAGGGAELIRRALAAGIDGFIFPDLPVDESDRLLGQVREAGLTASLLVAPTTSLERAEQIVRACSGFVYLLARSGITGETSALPEIRPRVEALRRMTDLPIACGFGISSAAHVRHVVSDQAGGADAAIVGSALVRRLTQADEGKKDVVGEAEAFTRELAMGLQG